MTCSSFAFGQSQLDMNIVTATEYKTADLKMNIIYNEILKKYAKNTLLIKNLKNAQRKWLHFRDAQLAMKFPKRSRGFYGSVLPMCEAHYLAELTQDRNRQLEEWLKPLTEGEVCSGSLGEIE